MKNAIITTVLLALVGAGIYYFIISSSSDAVVENTGSPDVTVKDPLDTNDSQDTPDNTATSSDDMTTQESETETTLGLSAGGNAITAYHYGDGDTRILLVGGIHGGYSWNTAYLAYELMDHFEANPDDIPENVTVTIVPALNPDGLQAVLGTAGPITSADAPTGGVDTTPGRFNANDVDLNRNFDCDWQADATWQSRAVSGGTEPFSEPEAQAIRDYVLSETPEAVVVYYSAANGVFASNCYNGPLQDTRSLTQVYADGSGYPAYEEFNYYEITGDMTNWLSKENIPAISVLLSSHDEIEWTKNIGGVTAVLESYAE